MGKRLRILYAAGPGNVVGTYRHWKERRDDPSQLAMTYSGQFYQVVQDLGARAYVIASCPVRDRIREGRFRIEHWPIPFEERSGPLYHLGQIIYGLKLFLAAVWFRTDVAVVCGGTHWFMLSLMSMAGIRVVPSLHCMLWRSNLNRGHYHFQWVRRLLRKWDGRFFRRHSTAILSVSSQLTSQVRSLQTTDDPSPLPPIYTFTPVYRPGTFDSVAPAPASRNPFKVLYIGRIERNKGVFDLQQVAMRLSGEGHTDIEFDLCGTGNAIPELRQSVAASEIGDRFRLHGHCNQAQLAEFLSGCHVVIAPTQRDFLEGFNKVVVEGVLSGRPVVTSSICPSLWLVRESVVEVPPDDVQAYGDAILRLRDNPALYQQLVNNAAALTPRFYDESTSWREMLRKILRSIQPTEASESRNPGREKAFSHPQSQGNGWAARISYGGIIAAVALGVLASLLGLESGNHFATGSVPPVTTKQPGTIPPPLGTASAALHHSEAGRAD